jgi:mono/diheme cytochrome c family protein
MAAKDRGFMGMHGLPAWVVPTVAVLVVLSFIPMAFIARARATKSPVTRLQIVPDMDQQGRFKAQQANPIFADGRAMRPQEPGTVAWGEADLDPRVHLGQDGDRWSSVIPIPVTEEVMRRGRERYDIYCAPCHGLAGAGDGIINARAERLAEGTWTPPTSLHSEVVLGREDGHLYNTIANGIRNMPAYGSQIDVMDRWAVVAYVRALQRSQKTSVDDVPPEVRPTLR